MLDAVDYARSRSDVIAISMSWGMPGFSGESDYDSHFASSFGATFFASSGDQAENASWPASSQNVVGVGGTTLNFNPDGSFANETVWNGHGGATGGGVSAFVTEPSYQISYGIQGSNGHRGVPDVSYDADPAPGYPIYTSFSGTPQWLTIGGTSAGAPQWAAIKSLGFFGSNSRYYAVASSQSYSSCFRDITFGSNGYYSASLDYDFCTGLGSPRTSRNTKMGDLGSGPPPTFFAFDNIVNGPDLALFLYCYKGLAPLEAMCLADLGGGVPPQFFQFDGKVDGKDVTLFLLCFKGLGPDP
jgi:hypothetical protein